MARKPKYYRLNAMLQWIKHEGNREACIRLWRDNPGIFSKASGSKQKHQAWEGGYIHHLEETMNTGLLLYRRMNSTGRELPFLLGDLILVLFFHDLEKAWKYGGNDDAKKELGLYGGENLKFILAKAREYGVQFTDDHVNALQFVHGEGEAYDPFNRIQRPLAALAHICDVVSARVWYDEPHKPGSW